MRDSNKHIVVMQWVVIATLAAGLAVGLFLLTRHADAIEQSNSFLKGDNESLRRQVEQARALPKITPEPLPVFSNSPATPTPTATPKR